MTIVPPKTIKLGSGPYDCQEALSDILCAVADEAHAKGWGRQEIVMAFQEVANAWYLGEYGEPTVLFQAGEVPDME